MTRRPPPAATVRALDRALTLPILNAAYRVSSMACPAHERAELLTVALREFVTASDAENKMKKTVTRIWLNPPAPAVPLIRWALENPELFPDSRVLQAGALLATVPFVGSVIAQLGRYIALKEPVTVPELRRRMVAIWGASSTVQEAVGKTVTTLRRLELVNGGGRRPIVATARLEAGPLVSAWLVHATLLARQVQSLGLDEAREAPELFWLAGLSPDARYPFLEVHSEGLHRRVWSIR